MTAPDIAAGAAPIAAAEFARLSATVYEVAGIVLPPGKEGLVRSRLARRLRELQLTSFEDYLEHVQVDASRRELAHMIDLLTTNKTSFFREAAHFDYLRDEVLARRPAGRRLRIWSAGCSSGEEPYTLAMVIRETLGPGIDARILATDISARVLAKAQAGVYAAETVAEVPDALRRKWFVPASGPGALPGALRVADDVRGMVRFARLNLMGDWPMKGPFDAIFCRNVMIYFDRPTQERLVNRYHALLAPGGHLFVGHSESLTALRHPLAYVRPAVYVR